MSGSITYGQLMGVLVATLTGCALAAWLLKLGRGPDAAAGPIVIAFGGVLVLAHFFAELKLLYAVLLLVGFAVGSGLVLSRQEVEHAGAVRGLPGGDWQSPWAWREWTSRRRRQKRRTIRI